MSHQLVNAFAALVAGAIAIVAALAVVKMSVANFVRRKVELGEERFVRLVGRAAIATDAPEQTLPEDGIEGGGNQERLDAHVDQARDRAGGVVRVQGGEDKVPGERGLDGDLRRLQIARFTDHDAVGVLAQEGAQDAGESQADARRSSAPA